MAQICDMALRSLDAATTNRDDTKRMEWLFDQLFDDTAGTGDKIERIRRTIDRAIQLTDERKGR